MKIFITGGSGYVGGHLIGHLLAEGHHVTATGMRPAHGGDDHDRFAYLRADTSRPGPWQNTAATADIVFNLAGRNIASRWSRRTKAAIYDSRILTTRHLTEALPSAATTVLMSTSAVGYYGDCGEATLTEADAPGTGFLAEVGADWEAEATAAAAKGARVVLMRFGVVLSAGGGAVAKMLPAFRAGLGGPIGSGQQWFPWIHLTDLIRALCFLMHRDDARGAFNLCAPEPVRQGDFARRLGRRINRPAILPAPAAMMRLLLGEMADTLLASQRAIPERLRQMGFMFTYPDIDSALDDIFNRNKET